MINVFQPSLGVEETLAVAQVMKSNWIGRGPKVAELQHLWAERLGVSDGHVIPTTCATEGLFQIAEAIGLRRGQEVVMPTIHFIGAANAVVSTGAKLVFCDVDNHTLVPTWDMIEEKLTRKTTAVFIMHYGGMAMPDYPNIVAECQKRELILVEDCATAPDTKYGGMYVGAAADYSVWSFDAMKIASAGDGGIMYAEPSEKAKELHKRINLGLTVESGLSSAATNKWWSFDVVGAHRRATMNDLTAAIILEQVKKLPQFVEAREQLCNIYSMLLKDTPDLILPPDAPEGSRHSRYMYWVQTASRDGLAEYLRANEIYTTFRYYPLHKIYGGKGLHNAERAAATTLSLPLHQSMTKDDVAIVCKHVDIFMRHNV